MEGRGPETSGDDRAGRGLDTLVWALTIAGMIAVAAGVAYYLSNSSFKLREVTYRDETVDYELIPVARESERPPAEASSVDGEAEPTRPVRGVRQPTPNFPWRAAARGVERGDVVLRCMATATGEVDACTVVEETPPGVGFGQAALASMPDARVTPREVDGVPVPSSIRFTIRFRMEP